MRVLAVVLGVLLAFDAGARDLAQRDRFKRMHPCPVTGKARGPCPGWVVDHVVPLCAGGPDRPSNMQWQTVTDARIKDRVEVRKCRQARRAQRSS